MPLFRYDGLQHPSHRSSRRHSPSPPPSPYIGPYSGNPNTRYANPSYTGYDDPFPSQRSQRRATHSSNARPTHYMPNAVHYIPAVGTTTTSSSSSRRPSRSHHHSYSSALPPSPRRHHQQIQMQQQQQQRPPSIRDPFGNHYNHRDLSPVRTTTHPRDSTNIHYTRRDVSPLGTSRFEQPPPYTREDTMPYIRGEGRARRARQVHGLGISGVRGSIFGNDGEFLGFEDGGSGRSREGSSSHARHRSEGADALFRGRSERRSEVEMEAVFRDGGFSDWMHY